MLADWAAEHACEVPEKHVHIEDPGDVGRGHLFAGEILPEEDAIAGGQAN